METTSTLLENAKNYLQKKFYFLNDIEINNFIDDHLWLFFE